MIRLLVAVVLTLVLLLARPGSAEASAEWCEYDPLVVIITPGGAWVPVFVTNGALGVEHSLAAQLAEMRYTAREAKGGRATAVELTVRVPDDLVARGFPVRSTASTGPLKTGALYAAAEGVSGESMTLRFTLPVP